LLGAEAITAQNDRDFSSGTIGNWAANTNGSGTCTYSAASIGGADDKQGLITAAGDEGWLNADLGADNMDFTSGGFWKCTMKVYVPAANTNKSVLLRWFEAGNTHIRTQTLTLSGDTWTDMTIYVYASDTPDSQYDILKIGFSGSPTAGDLIYFDDVSVKKVDISWVPYGTNTMDIDSDALKISYGSHSSGAYLTMTTSTDFSSDLVIGEVYKLTGQAKVGSGDSVDIRIIEGVSPWTTSDTVTITSTSFVPFELYFTAYTTNLDNIALNNMGAGEEVWLDNLVLKEVTEPNANAVKIYKEYSLTTEGWNAIDSGIDYNVGASWDFDVYANLMGVGAGTGAEARFEALGLLSEGEGTNWCLQSNAFDQWYSGGVTEAQDVTGPDDVANSAWTVTDPGGGVANSVNITFGPASVSGTYTYSVYVKEGTSGAFTLITRDNDAAAWRCEVDFQWIAGVLSVKNEDTGTGAVEQLGSTGWWRAIAYCPSVVAGNTMRADLYPSERMVDPGSSVTTIFYGAQLEATPYATSYIPTTTIPVTRTADAHQWTMSTAFKNLMGNVADSPFTMVCEWTPKFNGADIGGASYGVVGIAGNQYGAMYLGAGPMLKAYDGTNVSSLVEDWAKDTTYIYALRVFADNGDFDFEVGEEHGGSWTWDASPATYDGSFNPSTDLIIGYNNEYPFNIKNIYFWNTAKLQAWIEANF